MGIFLCVCFLAAIENHDDVPERIPGELVSRATEEDGKRKNRDKADRKHNKSSSDLLQEAQWFAQKGL